MTARIAKESRELLPLVFVTALLLVVPYWIWRRDAEPFGVLIFGLGCAIMGASAFGHELQHRTLPLLLSQPVARPVLWLEKMCVLGAGLAVTTAVLAGCLYVHGTDLFRAWGLWWFLLGVPLCAFCTAPCLTLLVRNAVAGAALAVLLPFLVIALGAWISRYLVPEAWTDRLVLLLLAGYCAAFYLLGYRKFRRLQLVEGPGRELMLPLAFEAVLSRGFGKPSGPFGALVRKELRLQQMAFFVAGLFTVVAVVGAGLYRIRPNWAEWILAPDFFIYMVVLPFLVGAVSIADERSWGVAAWHLALPASARSQWLAKTAVVLAASLGLGLLLPDAALGIGRWLLHLWNIDRFPEATTVCLWILVEWLAASLAVFTGSFCDSVLKAILLAFAIILAGALGITLTMQAISHLYVDFMASGLSGDLAAVWSCVGLLLLVALTQWFAFSNFRHAVVPLPRAAGQTGLILLIAGLLALLIITTSQYRSW